MSQDLLERPADSAVLADATFAEIYASRAEVRRDRQIAMTKQPVIMQFGSVPIKLCEGVPTRLRATVQRICEFGNLRENWDSYGGRPIDLDCGVAAINLILYFVYPNIPIPVVVPTSRGGVQIEWHRGGIDLEINVESPARFHVVFENQRTGEAQEWLITDDFRRLRQVLSRLSGD